MRTLSVIVWVLSIGHAAGQCDTTANNNAIREVESVLWSDYPRVHQLAFSALAHFRNAGPHCAGRVWAALGKVYWVNGDYDSSMYCLRKAFQQSADAHDDDNLAASYYVAANVYYYQGYYDSAEVYFSRSLHHYELQKNHQGQLQVLHDMALMYHRKGDYALSLQRLLESERIKELEPGLVHFVGDFTRGNQFFVDTLYYRNEIEDERKAYFTFRKAGNPVGVYQSLINLSVAYRELGDHRRSGYLAGLGSALMETAGDYPFWYLAAKEYGLAGMYDSCFYFHRKAFGELHRATQIKVVTTYEQIGESFMLFHQPDSARHYFEAALALNEKMNNRISIPGSHLSLARAWLALGNTGRAEDHWRLGMERTKGVSVYHQNRLYEFGRELFERMGQPEKALMCAERYAELSDSINRSETAVAMLRLQSQFQMERKDLKLEQAESLIYRRSIFLLSLAALTVLAACFIVALFWQRRKISMKNRLLLKSNDEQKALLQEVHHRVKNNLQYIVSLMNLQMHQSENSELHERLDEIKTRIMAMGIIHQRLYTSQGIFRVDVSGFAAELVDNLLNAMPSKVPVSRSLHLNPVEVNVDTAISIGLLLNELLTNAIKHAFVGHPSPALEVTISKDNECMLLRLRDNGPGYDFGAHSNGFGMRLVQLMLRKLNATARQPDRNTIEVLVPLHGNS